MEIANLVKSGELEIVKVVKSLKRSIGYTIDRSGNVNDDLAELCSAILWIMEHNPDRCGGLLRVMRRIISKVKAKTKVA